MIYKIELAEKIAAELLKIKAIIIQPDAPFTWASGWRSPIYCDNRVTLSHPVLRTLIKNSLTEIISRNFGEVELIAGVATGGIAQGALVADALNLPFVYVRSEPKKHGTGRQVEGEINQGQKTVIIEDLISTGKSSLAVLPPLQEAGCSTMGILATFSYGFELAEKNFEAARCPLYTLSDYDTLLKVALEMNFIRQDELQMLKTWRESPATWKAEV